MAEARPMTPSARPTVGDVARRASVSMMTVSRVLNNGAGVSPDMRARVQRAIRELNYVPNHAAQALAAKRTTRNVAFLFDTPNAAVLGEMVSAGFRKARLARVELVLIKVQAFDDPRSTCETIANLGIRGVILSPPLCDDVRLRVHLNKKGIRIVAIGCDDADPALSTIGIDDRRAAFELTHYLLQLGHRRIGFIAGHPRHRSSARRRAGYEAALLEHGVQPDPAMQWEGNYTFDSALIAAEHALGSNHRPTAIFASNDDMAAAVISVARDRGVSIPRSLSVCGFDDSEVALMVGPRLTTVGQSVGMMASWGIRQLAEELGALERGDEPQVRKVLLDHKIAYRESVAPPERTVAPHRIAAASEG